MKKPLFETSVSVVTLRVDGEARFTQTSLIQHLMELNLPLSAVAYSNDTVTITYNWVLPPPKEQQRAVVEALVRSSRIPPGVTLTISHSHN